MVDDTVIKHNDLNGNVSFIHCPDFDTADEPSTGDYAVVRSDGTINLHSAFADPYIYDHKWLFVAEDYQEFDVTQNQERSTAWMCLHLNRERYRGSAGLPPDDILFEDLRKTNEKAGDDTHRP